MYAARRGRLWSGAVVLLAVLWTSAACAQTDQQPAELRITDVQVGFRGLYKVGLWTPVKVTLQGGKSPVTGHVQLVTADGDGLPSRVTSPEQHVVPAGETKSVMMYARFGRIETELEVLFRDLKTGEVFARRKLESVRSREAEGLRRAMFSSQELVVGMGPSIGVEEAARMQRGESEDRMEYVALQSIEELPTRWYGYEGVSAVVFSTTEPEIYRQLNSTSQQLAALDEWIRRGGRLIISAGSQAAEIFSDELLGRFAPGQLDQITSLPQTTDLEAYSEQQEPVPVAPGDEGRLPVAKFKKPLRGVPQAPPDEDADLPVVIRRPYGFGQVIVVTVDLDRPPLAQWAARENLVSKLLGKPARVVESDEPAISARAATTGITDLLGQLRGALDQFAGIKIVPFFVVALMVFGYILLIGPGDYFLVRRVLKRMELTWVTFPLIVVIVSGGAYALANNLKGRELRLNQVDLVDVCLDMDKPLVRGTAWMNVFSPRTNSYVLRYLPQFSQSAEVMLGWLGLPGAALGGMNSTASSPPLTDRPYDFSPDLSQLDNVPVHIWSTKSFTARWTMPDPGLLECKVSRTADDTLHGQITSRLDEPLTDCWLAYGRWIYPIEKLQPGQTLDLEPLWSQREVLHSRLTGNRVERDPQKKQYTLVASPYDATSFDVPAILRQMMFYRASGGRNYVGLFHRFQPFTDLSEHLDLNRGILIGFTNKPASVLERRSGQEWQAVQGPEDKHWTCYRFVIPIENVRE